MCDVGIDLKQYFTVTDEIPSKINSYYAGSDNLTKYAILVMKDFGLADEFIDEFREENIKNGY